MKLEPCKFCRRESKIEEFFIDDDPQPWYVATCSVCPVKTYDQTTPEEAARIWNAAPIDSAAPIVNEDQQLAERLRDLLSNAFITGHMHGPSRDYQVRLKFRTLEESQQCHTLIEALVNPEYRESFIKQGVLAPFATAATAAPAEQSAREATDVIIKAWLWHVPERDQERARISIQQILTKHFPATAAPVGPVLSDYDRDDLDIEPLELSTLGHVDFVFDDTPCCKVCGLVRPAEGWTRPCKGPTELSLRAGFDF